MSSYLICNFHGTKVAVCNLHMISIFNDIVNLIFLAKIAKKIAKFIVKFGKNIAINYVIFIYLKPKIHKWVIISNVNQPNTNNQ